MFTTTRKQANNQEGQEGPTPKRFRQQINVFVLKNPGSQ